MANKNRTTTQSAKPIQTASLLTPRLPALLILIAIAVWSVFVLKNYFSYYPFNFFENLSRIFSLSAYPAADNAVMIETWVNHLKNLAYIFVFMVSAYGWGKQLLRNLEANTEAFIFRSVAGLGLTAAFMFTIGILGILYKIPVAAFIVTGFFLGVNDFKGVFVFFGSIKLSFEEKVYLFLISCSALVGLIGALAPETFYDSGVYHLGVPQLWINEHKMYSIPTIHMSYYPFNIELLYTVGLMLRDEMASKLTHWAIMLLSLMLLFSMVSKYFNRKTAWLSVLIFYTTPFAVALSGKTAIELGIGIFETAAVYAMLNYSSVKERRWLIISGACSGLAMGSKYISIYAGFTLFIMLLYIKVFDEKANVKEVLKDAAIFIATASVVLMPYLIRNYIWVKNPVAPLFFEKLGELKLRSLDYLSDPPRRPFTLRNFLMLPWDYAMGKDIQEPYCGITYLLLLPLFVFYKKHSGKINVLIVYTVLYFLLWEFIKAYVRLFVPALPIMAVVYAFWVANIGSAMVRKAVIAVLLLASVSNIQLAAMLQKYSENPLGVSTGVISKERYLAKGEAVGSYVSPNYSAIKWANENLPKDAKVLFIGETRALYFQRRAIVNNIIEFVPITDWANSSKDELELLAKIKSENITHILLSAKEVYRLKGYGMYYFTQQGWDNYKKFWNSYVEELFGADWVFVYKVLPQRRLSGNAPHDYMSEIYFAKPQEPKKQQGI